MKGDGIYILSIIIIGFIFALCLCRYNNIKKETYFNQFNDSVYMNSNNQIEEKRLHGCTGEQFKKKMYNFYKNLDHYQKTYQKKQETLHKYEDLTDELVEVKKNLIMAEEDVKECIPNFSENNN